MKTNPSTGLRALALASCCLLFTAVCAPAALAAPGTVVYEGKDGPGKGKHVVFLTGDEEYRGEEGMPMLAKVLSQRHGFKCTVLFAVDEDGTINPENNKSLPGAEALDSADAVVMLLRWRNWPEAQMKHFDAAFKRGVPIIGLRTSTHAFKFDGGSYKSFNDFGKRVLGEEWVSHWGNHKKEATKGIIEPLAKDEPILRGVSDIFGDTDVYEAHPPADAKILLRGQVLKGMNPTDPPADYKKKTAKGQQQGVNDPMMPVAWTRVHHNEGGKDNRIFCTTMASATDLQNEGLRRLVVNAVYWGLGMDVPAKADVQIVGDYRPTAYGFGGYRKGVKPESHALNAGANSDAGAKAQPEKAGRLTLNKGDHVAIIGNTLADRMQLDGYFETLLYAQFPEHDLVVRNLARAGDEVVTRHRSESFGTPDEWLTKVKADVVLAFFGFNESFKGEQGLDQFRSDLDRFLKETKRKNYSGRGNARVVLFSPIAAERHRDPNFPDPTENNSRLRLYTAAMAEVANSNGVQFVDLFGPTEKLYRDAAEAKKSLTINGIHLSEEGDQLLAPILFRELFGEVAQKAGGEPLRAAINEKSRMWRSRYRTVDGYNVYGGRSKMEYEQGPGGPKLSNYKVMQEEMTQRDVMTANRDKVVWAAARGQTIKPDDSNLPPVTKVRSNKPGPNPDESWPFLTAEQSMAKLKLHPGLKANVFASEEQFPELVNPVQMAWDTKGRLWVAAWYTYPERTPIQDKGDSLLIFEDTDGDGKADKCTHFMDDLNCPTGFQFYEDGVLVMQAPDLLFVRDTDGDGKADKVEHILMGLDSADSHHTTNSMVWEPGGAVYLSDGVFHRTQVETAWGPVRNDDAAIFRFEPRTGAFLTHIAYGFANPHGRVFDYWGNDFVTDATGNNTYFGPAFSGFIDYPQKHRTMRQFWERPSRPCPGTGILTSRHFPDDWQGNFLNLNVISFQGCYRVKMKPDGSGTWGESLPDLFYSEDPNFRPTFINTGPDGALYFADWHNPIIGHLQHHIRDPNRDHAHGRVFRITYEGRPLMKPAKIDGQPVEALLALLKEPENQTRDLARIELGKHDAAEVTAAVKKWVQVLDKKDPAYEHHVTEALWVHQALNVIDLELLTRVLHSTDGNARAAATRVLCYWRDRVPSALALLRTQAADDDPRVRLEAVRAASFFRTPEAVSVVLAARKLKTDYYLDYTIGETMRQLEPMVRKALGTGQQVAGLDAAGTEYFLGGLSAAELTNLPRTPPVLEAIVQRVDVPEAQRGVALHELSQQRKTTRAAVLLDMIDGLGRAATKSAEIGRLLPQQPAADLQPQRARLQNLSYDVSTPPLRQAGWAALVVADGNFDDAWQKATSRSVVATADLLAGVPLIYDPDIRAKGYDKVKPLLAATADAGDVAELRRAAVAAAVSMNREQKATFAALCGMIGRGLDVGPAARGVRALPRGAWTAPEAETAANAIVAWAKNVPADQRTTPEYVQAIQLAGDLAGLAPSAGQSALRRELKDLRVSVFVVNTVREQMRYDTPRLVVEAGKPFEVILENADFMPHNLAVVTPGSRKKVGEATMKMRPDQLDRDGRAFMPPGRDILGGTKLIEPGQRATLKMVAPNREGDYEYLCTYPGHWEMMWGTLVVTKDVDAYLQKNPEAKAVATGTGAHDHAHGN